MEADGDGDDSFAGESRNEGPGRFIVFEGLDGSGTSTQLQLLAAWLRDAGVPTEMTKEPSNGPIGAALRQAIEGRVQLDPFSMALAFAADRADHLHNSFNGIVKSLRSGRWVLCDRYVLSSLAYQVTAEVTEVWLRSVNQHVLEPDVTVFIDTSSDVCAERIALRSSHSELFHDEFILGASLRNYQRLVADRRLVGRLVLVNGNGKPDDVFGELLDRLGGWIEEESVRRASAFPREGADSRLGPIDGSG